MQCYIDQYISALKKVDLSHISNLQRSYISHNNCKFSYISHNNCKFGYISHNNCKCSYIIHLQLKRQICPFISLLFIYRYILPLIRQVQYCTVYLYPTSNKTGTVLYIYIPPLIRKADLNTCQAALDQLYHRKITPTIKKFVLSIGSSFGWQITFSSTEKIAQTFFTSAKTYRFFIFDFIM